MNLPAKTLVLAALALSFATQAHAQHYSWDNAPKRAPRNFRQQPLQTAPLRYQYQPQGRWQQQGQVQQQPGGYAQAPATPVRGWCGTPEPMVGGGMPYGNSPMAGGMPYNGHPIVSGTVHVNGHPIVSGTVHVNGRPSVTGGIRYNGPRVTGGIRYNGPSVTGGIRYNGRPMVTGHVQYNNRPMVTGHVQYNNRPMVTGGVQINNGGHRGNVRLANRDLGVNLGWDGRGINQAELNVRFGR